ncbi:LytTR family DNA-binding domain-containing protein [Ferruginibacter sp. HRS2-29]|uniref:LytR/AlgR family response regulator transcription factor n=1 Tax=Ferruginibacter sp. HRS2-29 TaxID=2487334 RepID=UPI0020CCD04B|nr:LytTR family DNA-binding domain-containing protein [Ferruginibacter sp. HRS2-29]MCP9750711.1 DNA-binding response regulator [Ferruginibacter sp. HRS2-29]
MKINCIVIEDEPLAMERVTGYIRKLPGLTLLQSFDNALDAFVFLKITPVDLIFLDINLGELSGIQFLQSIQFNGDVIITTAYTDFALIGYDLNVTDYLLKPFTFERFLQAVDKVSSDKNSALQHEQRDFFFVKTENRYERISYAEVLYIEGMRDYRKIHTTHKKIMTLQTFAELEKELPPSVICRVHKSYMISISKIDSLEKDEIHIGNIILPVSESYKSTLYKLIGR